MQLHTLVVAGNGPLSFTNILYNASDLVQHKRDINTHWVHTGVHIFTCYKQLKKPVNASSLASARGLTFSVKPLRSTQT